MHFVGNFNRQVKPECQCTDERRDGKIFCKFELETSNECGEKQLECCTANDRVGGSIWFEEPSGGIVKWRSPGRETKS